MNYAMVTIDTEAWHGDDPVTRFIWGVTRDGRHGIEDIVEMLDKHGIKGLFFLDFAECWDYGEKKIAEVAIFLREKGQTVGVHVHPDHMADSEREFLWQYSPAEQRDILERVTSKYEEIMGERPRYFRAGKYSADNDTLQIVEELGYKYEFSQFYGRNWCHVYPPITADRLCMVGGMLEVPVTSFVALSAFGYERVDKVDMEMTPFILEYVVKRFAAINDGQVLSLFGHSFSFVGERYSEDMADLFFDVKNRDWFDSALRVVETTNNIKLISPAEFEALYQNGRLDMHSANQKPSVRIKNPIISIAYFYATAWRIKSFNKKASLLMCGTVALALLAVCLILGVFFNESCYR